MKNFLFLFLHGVHSLVLSGGQGSPVSIGWTVTTGDCVCVTLLVQTPDGSQGPHVYSHETSQGPVSVVGHAAPPLSGCAVTIGSRVTVPVALLQADHTSQVY